MEVVSVQGEVRTTSGKASAKNMRKSGIIPAVIYGTEGNIHLTLNPKSLKHLVYTPDFKLAEVNVDGNAHKCIIKDIQFHPVTDQILHVDFLKLENGRKVKVEVPVIFEGIAEGVKTGGTLVKKLRRVKIKANAEDIVASMNLDVSALELGYSIRVKDIDPIDGIEIMNSPNIPVASVEVPRALRSEEAKKEEEEGVEEAVETTEE